MIPSMRIHLMAMVLTTLLPCLSGCSSCCKSPFRKTGPPLVEFSGDGPRFYAALDGPMWGEGPVNVHVLRVTDDGVQIRGPWDLPRRDSVLPAVAVHGDSLFMARNRDVLRCRPFSDPSVLDAMQVKEPPSSLMGAQNGCFVGMTGRVDWVDFSGARKTPAVVHQDPAVMKPVDFILRTGDDGIVAVDDEVFPRYAFVLRLDPDIPAVHRFTSDLPSGPNETYRDVIHVDGTLVIAATYGVMDGPGNTIYRWPISRKEHDGDPLGEFQSEARPGIPPRLLAGTSFTHVGGLGAIGDHIFLGAGVRGILHLPMGGEPAVLHDVGGWCLDLLVDDGRVVALVAVAGEDGQDPRWSDGSVSGDRQLVVLSWEPSTSTLAETARHDLPLLVDWLTI